MELENQQQHAGNDVQGADVATAEATADTGNAITEEAVQDTVEETTDEVEVGEVDQEKELTTDQEAVATPTNNAVVDDAPEYEEMPPLGCILNANEFPEDVAAEMHNISVCSIDWSSEPTAKAFRNHLETTYGPKIRKYTYFSIIEK